MASFPSSVDQVTNEWLTEVLGYPVQSFDIQPLGKGVGIMGLVTRLQLYAETGPKSLIAKFPSQVPENRHVAQEYDNYGRECRFYTEIAPTIPLRLAACHFAAFDPDSHDFILLLEDLQDHRLGDQVKGCTEADTRTVIDTLAKLHANTWQPERSSNIADHNTPMQRDGMVGGFQLSWPVILEQYSDLIPEVAISAGEKMPLAIADLMNGFCRDPLCIAHGDVRLDNMFFSDNEVILVDWQAVCRSAPEHDLAYFLTQSVPDDIRDKQDWVGIYFKALTDQGIDYSIDTCRDRYRLCGLYLLCYAVIIAGMLDMGNERGKALARTLLGNSFRALEAIDAFELLK